METATKRTHCPNCGARLPEQPLSICSYCAMPLDLATPKETGAQSPNLAKIQRIAEQPDFGPAMQRTPPEGPDYQAGRHRAARGRGVLAAGVVLVCAVLLGRGERPLFTHPLFVLGVLAAGIGAWWWIRGAEAMRHATAHPLVRRTALILDRRSDTALEGWWGNTTYYFKLEFPDGTTGEFAYVGRGASEDLFVNGMTGVAYTRGDRLLDFTHIRL